MTIKTKRNVHKLKAEIRQSEFSQMEIAYAVGQPASEFSRMLNGYRRMPAKIERAIEQILAGEVKLMAA